MGIGQLVTELKQNGQDFEWYPTTREIIEAMYWDIKSHAKNHFFGDAECASGEIEFEYQNISILDIGAGNCKLYTTLKEISETNRIEKNVYDKPYADGSPRAMRDEHKISKMLGIKKYMVIEKSQILIDNMPPKAVVVGTSFNENTLIDKPADVVFCNPPYSEYASWAERIIKEANAKYVYLVIPQRWGKHKGIASALKHRRARVKIVGQFDFLESEDRKARAKVSLVKVYLAESKGRFGRQSLDKCTVDPFELWFNETFKIDAQIKKDDFETARQKHEAEKQALKNAIVNGGDLVSSLVALYDNELNTLVKNYQKVAELDAAILKELNVNVENLMIALKEKIEHLKNRYWQEIFDNLTDITTRLTSKTRSSLLGTLASNTNIDFTQSNIRSVVVWVIKNASNYFEEQMLDMYDAFTSEDGIKLYKSNKHWVADGWRYASKLKEKGIKYALDYRIVLHGYRDYSDREHQYLTKEQTQKIKDLLVIAKNLDFSVDDNLLSGRLSVSEKNYIYFSPSKNRRLEKGAKTHFGRIEDVFYLEEEAEYQYKIDGIWTHYLSVKTDDDIFTTVKSFKNGNNHYQFNQKFIKKFNLEVARIRGWIKSPQEATTEFDITIEEANEYWNSSFNVLGQDLKNLLPNFNLSTNQDAVSEDAVKTVEIPTASEVRPTNLLDLLED